MTKIYKVTTDKLTFDRGLYDGTVTIGYYLNKETAERVAEKHPETLTNTAARVEEIEVNEE